MFTAGLPDESIATIPASCCVRGIFHLVETQQGLFDRVAATSCHCDEILTESLILAQDERWRRASYMQVKENALFGVLLNWRTGE